METLSHDPRDVRHGEVPDTKCLRFSSMVVFISYTLLKVPRQRTIETSESVGVIGCVWMRTSLCV